MRFVFSVLVLSGLLISCKKEDTQPLAGLFPKINMIEGRYLFTKEWHAEQPTIGGTANFEYINNRLSKRDGGYASIPTSGGYTGFYVNGIYDTVQYTSPTTITVISAVNLPGLISIPPKKREFTVDNGLIVNKITYNNLSDTMYYFYNTNKMLIKTEQYSRYLNIDRDFIYDNNNNLIKITTLNKSKQNGAVISTSTSEELFGGYDDKPNPLKRPTLWQDILYRSLSQNNFTTYSYKSGSNTETKRWTLVYDSNGNVDYSR